MPEKNIPELAQKVFVHGGIALLGGAARYFFDNQGKPKKIIEFIAFAAASSFVGLVFGLSISNFTDSYYLQTSFAGVGGYMGKEGITWIFELFKTLACKLTGNNKN